MGDLTFPVDPEWDCFEAGLPIETPASPFKCLKCSLLTTLLSFALLPKSKFALLVFSVFCKLVSSANSRSDSSMSYHTAVKCEP